MDDLAGGDRGLGQGQLQILVAAEAQLLIGPDHRGIRHAAGLRQGGHGQVDDGLGIFLDIDSDLPLGFAQMGQGILDPQKQRRQ